MLLTSLNTMSILFEDDLLQVGNNPELGFQLMLALLAGTLIAIFSYHIGKKRNPDNKNVCYENMVNTWVAVLEGRDHETEGHSQRVTAITDFLAQKIGNFTPVELENIHYGALLHDIGKIAIPDSILLKPGALSATEREVMQTHTEKAYEWFQNDPILKNCLVIPHYHHERWDGLGYPCGLKGEETPLEARLFAIIDSADAICSDRPYRKGSPPEVAYRLLSENSGTQFDPTLVQLFIENDVLNRKEIVGDAYQK